MVVRYRVILPYYVMVSSATWRNTTTFYSINRNNHIIDTTNSLGKVGKKILEKMGHWVTEHLKRNYWAPEFRLPKYFGSDMVHHFADPKFQVPKPKSFFGSGTQIMNTPREYCSTVTIGKGVA